MNVFILFENLKENPASNGSYSLSFESATCGENILVFIFIKKLATWNNRTNAI